jgi:hypothetical protein
LSGLNQRAEAAQLDCFQTDAARRLALVMPPNVVKLMNAFVGADRDVRCRRHFGHAGKIVRRNGLFEEI